MTKLFPVLGALFLFVATTSGAETFPGALPASSIDPAAMDRTINPCVDFYQFSCGNWLKTTGIPSDRSSWYRSFSNIDEQNLVTMNSILVNYSQGIFDPPSVNAQKLGDFYTSCMNTPMTGNSTQ